MASQAFMDSCNWYNENRDRIMDYSGKWYDSLHDARFGDTPQKAFFIVGILKMKQLIGEV